MVHRSYQLFLVIILFPDRLPCSFGSFLSSRRHGPIFFSPSSISRYINCRDTPQGPRSAAWLAGPGCLPGDIEPPPYRPILALVDYSPLQELTHRSEPDHALYSVLASPNFRNVSAGELEALFTWARHFQPDEAGILPFRDLRTALITRLRTQWDIHMVPSDLEFRYVDLQGDVFQVPNDWTIIQLLDEYRPESTTTSNLLGWSRVLHNLSYCDYNATEFVKV